ncbi:MAG: hypothetical protein ACTSPD_09705 [Promethearchaeota archaeon]
MIIRKFVNPYRGIELIDESISKTISDIEAEYGYTGEWFYQDLDLDTHYTSWDGTNLTAYEKI